MAGAGSGRSVQTLIKKKRISKIARGRFAKVLVFRGSKMKTAGGLFRKDLKRNKRGKVVSKKASAHGFQMFPHIEPWHKAFMEARADLGIDRFLAINGKSPQGKAFYTKACAVYARRDTFPIVLALRAGSVRAQSDRQSDHGKRSDQGGSVRAQSDLQSDGTVRVQSEDGTICVQSDVQSDYIQSPQKSDLQSPQKSDQGGSLHAKSEPQSTRFGNQS